MSKGLQQTALVVAVSLATGGIGVVAGVATWSSVLVSAGIAGGMTAVSLEMQRRADKKAQRTAAAALADRRALIRSPIAPRATIYGTTRVGGAILWAGNSDADGQRYLWLVIAVAGHKCQALHTVYFGDRESINLDQYGDRLEITYTTLIPGTFTATIAGNIYTAATVPALATAINAGGQFNAIQSGATLRIARVAGSGAIATASGQCTYTIDGQTYTDAAGIKHRIYDYWWHDGDPNQAAPAELVSVFPGTWTTAHRGRGIAYVTLRLRQDPKAWADGLPTINFLVQGKLMYDPRDGTTGWSQYAAQVALDVLRTRAGVADANIDMPSFASDTNVCAELVNIPGGGQQFRYTVNGSFFSDQSPLDVLDQIRVCMAGDVVKIGAHWFCRAGTPRLATIALTADDFMEGLTVTPRQPLNAQFNTVSGSFVHKWEGYKVDNYPVVKGSGYIVEDGREIAQKMDFPFVDDAYFAQRLAWIYLRKSRQGMVVSGKLAPRRAYIAPSEIASITLDHFGFSAKLFECVDWQYQPDGSTDVVLREYSGASYLADISDLSAYDPAPNTNLTDPFAVSTPQNVQAFSGTETLVYLNGTIQPRVRLTWTPASDGPVVNGGHVVVARRRTGTNAVEYLATLVGDAGEYWVDTVHAGDTWDFFVQFVSRYQRGGAWGVDSGHTVVGKEAPPSNVGDFRISVMADGTREFTWAHVTDIDVINGGGYEIRHLAASTGEWSQMARIHDGILVASPYETNQLGAGEYTFAIRAVDSSGNYSAAANYITATIPDPRIANALMFRHEHANGWIHTWLTDAERDNPDGLGCVSAVGQYTWDSLVTWDDWSAWSMNPVDTFTAVSPVMFLNGIGSTGTATFKPVISGVAKNGIVMVEYRTSQAFGEPHTAWTVPTGDLITAFSWQARITVTAQPAGAIAELCAFTWIADAKLIHENINDSNTSTWGGNVSTGRIIPIANSYARISRVELALQNVGAGFTWDITSKDPAAPKIRIFNAAGTPVDALVDASVFGLPS